MAESLSHMDIEFKRESLILRKKFTTALVTLGNEYLRRRLDHRATQIFNCKAFLNKSKSFLDEGISLGVKTTGMRLRPAGRPNSDDVLLALIQYMLNRWQRYIHRTDGQTGNLITGEITGDLMTREIKLLEAIVADTQRNGSVLGSVYKGYKFDLRKYAGGKDR